MARVTWQPWHAVISVYSHHVAMDKKLLHLGDRGLRSVRTRSHSSCYTVTRYMLHVTQFVKCCSIHVVWLPAGGGGGEPLPAGRVLAGGEAGAAAALPPGGPPPPGRPPRHLPTHG